MTDNKNVFSDKEFTIMSEIMDNESITQRQLSRKLGISVSTVNALMNKMIKEGFIKMTQVSQKQVFYMLTPAGMMEKAKKTVRYLRIHYKAFFETKEKIKETFKELAIDYDIIFVLKSDDEMGEMIGIAIGEIDSSNSISEVRLINKKKKIDFRGYNSAVLVHMNLIQEVLNEYAKVEGLTIINLAERL